MTQIDDPPPPGSPYDPRSETPGEDRSSVSRVVVGAVLGFAFIYGLVLLMCWLVGITIGAAAGVGLFVALFGGAGFGAMVGGSMPSDHRS